MTKVDKHNKRLRLQEELLKTFIHYQYRLDNPMPSVNETSASRFAAYRTNPIVRAKVEGIVIGIMTIIDKVETECSQ